MGDNESISCSTFSEVIVPTYGPTLLLSHGKGLEVWDQANRSYLDFTSGIAVTALGHAPDSLITAFKKQAELLWHVSNIYTNEPVLKLAKALVAATFADQIFFCNSGAEANEAAFKLARKYGHDNSSPTRSRILSCINSFHGRTLFTVSVGGQAKYSKDFAPLPLAIDHIPFNNLNAMRAAMKDDVCAIVVEPVQGEGGVLPADSAYLQGLRTLCDQTGALLIFDEVQCGMGRTGELYAYMNYGVTPDILTSAKALGNGFPIGAMLTTRKIASAFSIGTHGTTYGGNPLGCAIALKVLETINTPSFLTRVRESGQILHTMLKGLAKDYPHIIENVRGSGLLQGAALTSAWHGRAADIVKACEANGLLILNAGPNVLRLVPALIVSDEQITQAEKLLRKTLDQLQAT